MNEGMPSSSTPRTMSSDSDAVLTQSVIEKMRQNNTGEEALSEKELEDAAATYMSQMHEKGLPINVDKFPVKEMINARKELRGVGVSVVTPDGAVLHADSSEDVRKVITEHNEEKHDNQ